MRKRNRFAGAKQELDSGLERLQSVICHLEVHVLTEARKRLEILSAISNDVLKCKLVGNGNYKIEFQLDHMDFNSMEVKDFQPAPIVFSNDAARMKVKDGVVYYGVKSSQSAMFKEIPPQVPERHFVFFQHDVESNWQYVAKSNIAALLADNSVTGPARQALLSLEDNTSRWVAAADNVNHDFLPRFVSDSAKVEKAINKLNYIIDGIWAEKTAGWDSLRRHDSLIVKIKPPKWPIPNPDLLFPGFEQAGTISRACLFTKGYLAMFLKFHYSGSLGQTNYEGLHQASLWVDKVIREDRRTGSRSSKYLSLISDIQMLETEIRKYEKLVRGIPMVLTKLDISSSDAKTVEHAFRYLCDFQECRIRTYELLLSAISHVLALEMPELANVLTVFDKMALRVSVADPAAVGPLMEMLIQTPNPRKDQIFEDSLRKYASGLVEFSQQTRDAREKMLKNKAAAKSSLKNKASKLEAEFLSVVENDLAPVSPIHARIFIDEIERIKAHSNFKQGIMIESDAKACMTPEKILQVAICLISQGRMPYSKSLPDKDSVVAAYDLANKMLYELIEINGRIADDLSLLGSAKLASIEKAKAYGHIEHNFEDIFPSYRELLLANSTHQNLVVRYSERINNPGDGTTPHRLTIQPENIGGAAFEAVAPIGMHPGKIKEYLTTAVAGSKKASFEDIVLGQPYTIKAIKEDFGARRNDYLTHVMPYVENLIVAETLKSEFGSGGMEKRLIADSIDENTLHGAVIAIGQTLAENPAKLLGRPNTAKDTLKTVAGRETLADIEKYNILKKLIPLRNMSDMIHRKTHESIYLSLKDFKTRIAKR